MDISSKGVYPSCDLSNFAPHAFELDGVKCASMEGFLQSLKYRSPSVQVDICGLAGSQAKFAGKKSDWQRSQTLYWKEQLYGRSSARYQALLDRAFDELAKNPNFQAALLATGDEELTHQMGKTDITKTVLTEREFISRLLVLREALSSK